MADYTHSELLQALGNNAAEFGKSIANKAGNFVCALYAQYPGAFIPPILGDMQRGLWDSLCSGRPAGLPGSPNPGFSGGQCSTAYGVEVAGLYQGTAFTRGDVVEGPVLGAKIHQGELFPGSGNYVLVLRATGYNGSATGGNVSPVPGEAWVYLGGVYAASNPYTNIQITNVVRMDGLPDNCGNPPSGFPPGGLPPGAGSGTITGPHSSGGTYVLPVLLKPSLVGEINVDVGGVNVKFDFSGATIGAGTGDLTAIMDAINDAVAQIVAGQCLCADIPDENSYDTDVVPDQDGTSKDELQGLEWVRITITQSASNAKSQSGNGASDVYYAGWFSFVANGASLPREPIHFREAIFRAPDGATGYEYCLYQGYRGTATEYKRPPTAPVV